VSQSDILERPDVREGDTGNANEVFHYVKKNKIAESAVMGTLVEALCGEVFPVTKAPKPGSPVCPACKEVQGLKGYISPRADFSLTVRRRRSSCRRSGAGQRCWMTVFSSAPSSTAMPKKKQYSSAAIGVASAP
jgi:hypothetical protein